MKKGNIGYGAAFGFFALVMAAGCGLNISNHTPSTTNEVSGDPIIISPTSDLVASHVYPVKQTDENGNDIFLLPDGYVLTQDENGELIGVKQVPINEYGIVDPVKVQNQDGSVYYTLPSVPEGDLALGYNDGHMVGIRPSYNGRVRHTRDMKYGR